MTDTDTAFTVIDRVSADRFQPLRRELGISSFGINLIRLAPGQRGRVHVHDHQEEAYLVLDGELTLIVERDEHVLGPDHAARVGPGARRQLVNAGPADVVVLALGGSGEHAGRDALAWESWDDDGPGRQPQEVPLPEDLPVA